jgi:hypothetical protein
MSNKVNLQFAICRKILILSILCLFLISQNISGFFHNAHAPISGQSEIKWELLIINMSEIILVILYYSQLDMDISEHFIGSQWDDFLNSYVFKSFNIKILVLKLVSIVLPLFFILYSMINENYFVFIASIVLFTMIYLLIAFDAYMLYKSAGKASGYFK